MAGAASGAISAPDRSGPRHKPDLLPRSGWLAYRTGEIPAGNELLRPALRLQLEIDRHRRHHLDRLPVQQRRTVVPLAYRLELRRVRELPVHEVFRTFSRI